MKEPIVSNPTKNEQALIDQLKADLVPVRPTPSVLPVVGGWLFISTLYVLVVCALLGPFRPGFMEQLLGAPRFSVEMLLGAAAAVCFAVVALAESLPGLDVRWVRRVGWVLSVGWLAQFLVGLEYPTFPASMIGKRDHCAWEAYVYSVPPLAAMIWLQWRRFVLQPVRAVGYAALAASLIPALAMQIACMYEARHILFFHVAPIAILSAVALTTVFLRTKLPKS